MKKLVIIPAYNEAASLDRVISDIKVNAPGFDYIIINDCSTDKTEELCRKNKYNVINLPVNLGIGGAMQTGYLYAREYKYDVAVQFDGDGQHNAEYLPVLLQYMKQYSVDMVIGSRFITKDGFQSSFTRRIGINFFTTLIKVITKESITDATSGFRMVNKKIINSFCRYYPKDYPEPESIVSLIREGYTVKEMPVEMNERIDGVSSINLVKSIYYMIKVSLAILIDRLKPISKEELY